MNLRKTFNNLGLLVLLMAGLSVYSCDGEVSTSSGGKSGGTVTSDEGVKIHTFRVINSFPHDTEAFTQGLVFDQGEFFEGTGLRGRSSLRRVDLRTGDGLVILELSSQFFGEGITTFDGKIAQLTLSSNVGFVYDRASFEKLSEFSYPTAGWGITYDGENLIMSDGTATIRFLDPQSFEVVRSIEVFGDDGPVTGLNELEFIKGEIYANIFPTEIIVIISSATGKVTGFIDLIGILSAEERTANAVTNGIAYDSVNDRLFVTGKLWPKVFEIALVPID
ncbi:glutaminyl-peptide cyclotransferase [Desulfobacterota bacterium AH_259_B03_O07]|nr:glutaminyl-peptide cyclotransferase [Desulfobacterota bacterium AH_259_B03_O07]